MFTNRKFTPLIFAGFLTFLFFVLFQGTGIKDSIRYVPQVIGLADEQPSKEQIESGEDILPDLRKGSNKPNAKPSNLFAPGAPKPVDEMYTRTLVIGRLKENNMSWIQEQLYDMLEPNGPLQTAIYVVNDKHAPLHPPKNKGHEGMVYLSYIIDHYDNLSDISIFMHAHRKAWHNNDVLDNDAAQIIRYLSPARVTREGYMNLRCHWDPGCPDWMHPGAIVKNNQKQEEILIAEAWGELFPLDQVPTILAQPCCAQFALSRERIMAIPRSRYVFFRDWFLRTPLDDSMSGRVWEYMWQFVWTGNAVECPNMHACYCDGYGICFGDADKHNFYYELKYHHDDYKAQLDEWRAKQTAIENAKESGLIDDAAKLEVPEIGRDEWLLEQIDVYKVQMKAMKDEARERGKSPENRAAEAGRPWKEGDGF